MTAAMTLKFEVPSIGEAVSAILQRRSRRHRRPAACLSWGRTPAYRSMDIRIGAALACAATEAPKLPLFVGGHSVSAQMASKADANDPLAAEAIISMGFPRKGDPANTAHLDSTTLPMLLIQGTKDILGSEAEIADMAGTLGDRATVRWVQGASHGFNVEGRQDGEVIGEVANHINDYIRQQ